EPFEWRVRQHVVRHVLLEKDAPPSGNVACERPAYSMPVRRMAREHLVAERVICAALLQVTGIKRLVHDCGVRPVLPRAHHRGREVARTGPHRDAYAVVLVHSLTHTSTRN